MSDPQGLADMDEVANLTERADRYVCGDCGYRPLGRGRPSIDTCPRCRGDFTWTPETREKVAQQLRPYMSDEDAAKATEGVRRALEDQ